MTARMGLAAVAAALSVVAFPSFAQKSGGILKIEHMDTPPQRLHP